MDDVVDKFAAKINNEAKQIVDLSTPPYSGLPQIKPTV